MCPLGLTCNGDPNMLTVILTAYTQFIQKFTLGVTTPALTAFGMYLALSQRGKVFAALRCL